MKKEIENLLRKLVYVENEEERDAVLKIYKNEGVDTSDFACENDIYPYSISQVWSLTEGKYRVIRFFFVSDMKSKSFVEEYNKLTSESTKRNFLVKEKIKNLKAAVLITNDNERDAFLKICEEAGLGWSTDTAATAYKPEKDYPYVIGCEQPPCFDPDEALRYCAEEDWADSPVISFNEFLTRLDNHQYEIAISCYDGKTTTARMMIDGKEVRSSEARCHKDDKFNWGIGAKLAAERLWEKKPKKETEELFNVGDRVQVRANNSFQGLFGTVRVSYPDLNIAGVELDNFKRGTTFGGKIGSARGVYFETKSLKKIEQRHT